MAHLNTQIFTWSILNQLAKPKFSALKNSAEKVRLKKSTEKKSTEKNKIFITNNFDCKHNKYNLNDDYKWKIFWILIIPWVNQIIGY